MYPPKLKWPQVKKIAHYKWNTLEFEAASGSSLHLIFNLLIFLMGFRGDFFFSFGLLKGRGTKDTNAVCGMAYDFTLI